MIDLARYVVFSKINGKASMEGMSASSLGHVHLDRLNDIVDVAHNLDVDSGTSSAQPARHICRAKEYNQHIVTTPFIDKVFLLLSPRRLGLVPFLAPPKE
jgi:hypothetical protein